MIGVKNPGLAREFASDLTPSSFFDNPIGSSVLLHPMDVVKPPQEELQKSKPGLPIPSPLHSTKQFNYPCNNHSVPLTIVKFTRPSVPDGWAPVKGVANEGVVDRVTPNLFFRFRCQLYAVYCDFNGTLDALVINIERVRSLPHLHRRCWSCADSPIPSNSWTFSSTCSSCSPGKPPRR